MSKVFDKLIDIVLVKPADKGQLQAVRINTPTYGPKPMINFKISVVPSHAVYQVELRINNLQFIPDIRQYTIMHVTVGYRDPTIMSTEASMRTRMFSCHIFSAWQESPLPDSVTVFLGVADGAGEYGVINPQRPVRIVIHEQPTVKQYIDKCAAGWGLTAVVKLPSAVLSAVITAAQGLHKTIYDTAEAIQDYVQTAMGTSKQAGQVVVWVFEQTLYVISTESVAEVDITENAAYLDSVYSAVMSGAMNNGTVQIRAPYNPAVTPLSVVKMSTNFFQGAALPNGTNGEASLITALDTLADGAVGNTGRMMTYRVIKMDIEFSTTGDTNIMDLLVVNAVSVPLDAEKGIADLAKFASLVAEDTATVVEFGTQPPAPESTPAATVIPAGSIYTVRYGDYMETIARKQLGDVEYDPNEAQLGAVKQPVSVSVDGTITWEVRTFWPEKIQSEWLWPLIWSCTKAYKASHPTAPVCDLERSPELIVGGQLLAIPNVSLPDSGRQFKEVFKQMAQWYQGRPLEYLPRGYMTKIKQLAYCYVAFGGEAWE